MEVIGVPGENQRPVTSHWQTLSHNVVSSTPHLNWIQTHNVSACFKNSKMKKELTMFKITQYYFIKTTIKNIHNNNKTEIEAYTGYQIVVTVS